MRWKTVFHPDAVRAYIRLAFRKPPVFDRYLRRTLVAGVWCGHSDLLLAFMVQETFPFGAFCDLLEALVPGVQKPFHVVP